MQFFKGHLSYGTGTGAALSRCTTETTKNTGCKRGIELPAPLRRLQPVRCSVAGDDYAADSILVIDLLLKIAEFSRSIP